MTIIKVSVLNIALILWGREKNLREYFIVLLGVFMAAQNIISILAKQAQEKPQQLAYTFLSENTIEQITFRELREQALSIASYLQERQAQGKRCLILLRPGISYITSFLGCLAAGVIAVPAYPPRNNRHMKRLQAIIDDSQADFFITHQNMAEKCCFDQEMIIVEQAVLSSAKLYKETNIEPEHLAYLQYTSGSTGSPKGVMITHANIIANLQLIKGYTYTGKDDKMCSWLPPYHDMGLIGGILYTLFIGVEDYLMAPNTFLSNPFIWLDTISKYQITITPAPNFAYDLCVDMISEEKINELNLSSLASAINGAEPVREKTIRRFYDKFARTGLKPTAMCPVYGMAEMTLILTGYKVFSPLIVKKIDNAKLEQGIYEQVDASDTTKTTKRLVACGTFSASHPVKIVNPDTFEECPTGIVGEIWADGPSKAIGYWNNPDATKEYLHAQLNGSKRTFYRTGDLGFLDENNEIYIVARLKDLLIIRGRNIYPQDIEATVANAHEQLITNGCAAFMLTEDMDDERLVVVQEVKRHAKNFNTIFEKILQDLISIEDVMPQQIILIREASLPKTSSGKVQRRLTRIELNQGELKIVASWHSPSKSLDIFRQQITCADVPYPTNSSDIYNVLCQKVAILSDLAPDNIDLNLSFNQLGFDSLKAVMFAGNLSRWLKTEINPAIFWEKASINALAQHLSALIGFETAIEKPLQAQLKKPAKRKEKIAIIGMSCRFPHHVNNTQDFWDLLIHGKDGVTEIPTTRWNKVDYYDADINVSGKIHTNLGGFVNHIEYFDPHFFGINREEAKVMDPQQRLVLQVAWQSLENADILPSSLKDSATSVYIGVSHNDYESLLRSNELSALNAYACVGNALSAVAGRLSYFLGLQGESEVIDTACSSSLVALHHACRSLQSYDSDLALAGGVNIILDPDIFVKLSDAKMLSHDGHCKTFDESANGYVRGEGCGIVVCKRLSDAKRDGDNILAVITGSAINQDGASNGLTAPNGEAQEKLYLKALADANVNANDIDYIETHGTGTILGDPIEVRSLSKVYRSDRNKDRPLILGAVKSNIGHLEPAAGIAGFIKLVLSLKNEVIPPNLHFKKLNPNIDAGGGIVIPVKPHHWKRSAQIRKAAVSAFGFTGTNAHFIVEEAPHIKKRGAKSHNTYQLLSLSAKTRTALKMQADQYIHYLKKVEQTESLENIAYTAATCREHFNYRLAVVAKDTKDLINELESHHYQSEKILNTRTKIAFLFTGQGSQYTGMGKALYTSQPYFKQTIDYCDSLSKKIFVENNVAHPLSIKSLLFDKRKEDELNSTRYTQLALFCLEYALAKLWQRWGIMPDYVLGHSVGEIVAATIAEVLTLEDALRLIIARGALMGGLPIGSGMLAVSCDEERLNQYLAQYHSLNKDKEDTIEISAYNARNQNVVSGSKNALANIEARLRKDNIKVHQLCVSHAFHSRFMEPILDTFQEVSNQISYHNPKTKMVSNITGYLFDDKANPIQITGNYWTRHIREPVKFKQGMQTLLTEHCNVFIEIGSDPILTMLTKSAQYSEADKASSKYAALTWIHSLQRKTNDNQMLLQAVAHAFTIGLPINWKKFYARKHAYYQKIILPTYPFQLKKYWINSHAFDKPHAVEDLSIPWRISQAINENKFIEEFNQLILNNTSKEAYDLESSFLENGLVSLEIVSIFQAFEKKWKISLPTHFDIDTLITIPTNKLARHIYEKFDAISKASKIGEEL